MKCFTLPIFPAPIAGRALFFPWFSRRKRTPKSNVFGPKRRCVYFAPEWRLVVSIIVALGIILVAQLATRNVQLIPSGLQNFVEWLVESLYGFFESILGADMVKRTFWFFGTIFIFILFSNWFGLVPGLGTVGWDVGADGHVHKPLLRGVNADLNMTLGMAAIFMILWLYWCLKALGPGGFAGHIFYV